MLTKVKQMVQDLMNSDESFDEYYMNYIFKVQDENIEAEIQQQLKSYLSEFTILNNLSNQIELNYRGLM